MSSIYRKGRDGYYYYQTYVHNPETGKKNKRIFHSLGTKDQSEAEEKQAELDNQYEQQVQSQHTQSNYSFFTKNRKTLATILGTIIITIFVMDLFESKPPVKNINKEPLFIPEIKVLKPLPDVGMISGEEESHKTVKLVVEEKNNPELLKPVPVPEPGQLKLTIPKHTVVRVDRLSGAFDQGKVYVTVNQNASKESLRLLCNKISQRYNEFSNIVICLYANNRTGKEMANGSAPTVSKEKQKESWLAMYTYNSVEGEYFDDNPGGYLGAY